MANTTKIRSRFDKPEFYTKGNDIDNELIMIDSDLFTSFCHQQLKAKCKQICDET